MGRNLPPLNALRAFEAAGRHGSFSRAAEELSVSHSAISRHVRGLEGRLGISLFRDLPRGVELTPEGRNYLERVLPAFDAIAAATDELSQRPKGQVMVNSEPIFAERFIMPRLAQFQNAFPEVELRLEASNRLANVEHYEADMAVRFAHLGRLDVPSDLLSDAPISVYATPEFAARIATPSDLLHVPRLRDRHNGIWEVWFKAAGVDTDGTTDDGWRPSTPLSYVAALEGHGAYLSSAECVSHDVAAGRLVQCFDISVRDGAFFLVYGSRGLRRAAAKQVCYWLLEQTQPYRTSDRRY